MESDSNKKDEARDEMEETGSRRKERGWNWINKEWSATIVFSGAVLLLIAFLVNRHELFGQLLSYIFDVLRPIIIGLVIAFVLYRPACRVEDFLRNKFQRKCKRLPVVALSVLSAYLMLLIILAIIIWIVVPSFGSSIMDFADNIILYYNNIMDFLNSDRGEQILNFLNENGFNPAELRSRLTDLTTYIPTAISTVSTWAGSLIGGLVDFFIGLIFSVYVLAGRHKLKSQGQRLMRHYLSKKKYNWFVHYGRLTFTTFSNFITGQLSDAMIFGLLIFLAMTIGGLEYPMMIAVILGLTNMIPYVGPWIGTIFCALILLMVNPWHAVALVIIVIVAQQVDSNLIYPRVVGSSIGLPAIWVLFAITVGGGLFGILGMIIGVPIMSIVYTVFREKTAGDEESENASQQKERWHLRRTVQKLRTKIREKRDAQEEPEDKP